MKKTLLLLSAACALSATLPAFAADTSSDKTSTGTVQACNAPVTRASLQRELAALQAAGYSPVGNDNSYPANLQRAQRIVTSQSPQCSKGE